MPRKNSYPAVCVFFALACAPRSGPEANAGQSSAEQSAGARSQAGAAANECPPCNCQCPVASTQHPSTPQAAQSAEAKHSGSARSEAELLERYEGKKAKRTLKGKATYYSNKLSGRKTASGERYDPKMFTAAHKHLPFGTVVRVVRTDTNRYVYVRINDRGPFGKRERIIDVSYIAAERLGMLRAGVVPVRVEVLE